MEILDISLRAASTSLLLLGIFVLLRDARGTKIGRLSILFMLGVVGYLISSAPFNAELPEWLRIVGFLAAIPNIVFFWMMGRALFEDDFSPSIFGWALAIVMVGGGLLEIYVDLPGQVGQLLKNTASLIRFALIAHVMMLALKGRDQDLIEQRRLFRLVFVTVICIYVGITLLVEFALTEEGPPLWLNLVNVSTLAVVVGFVVSYLVSLRADDFVTDLIHVEDQPAAPTAEELADISAADKVLLERLTHAMEEERIWLDEGVSIGLLATKLRTQEHRLRRLINQQLGFKNFSQFLNSYRIAEAQEALRDPDQAHLPILSIALGLGFGSIGTFNRAFKDQVGVTPSEYRRV